MTSAGYIKLLDRAHPLADSGGQVFEHRKVLYDVTRGQPQECAWCGTLLEWNDLVVDHLDENKVNNDVSNLVPACNGCNRARGAMLPFVADLTDTGYDLWLRQVERYRKHRKAPGAVEISTACAA